MKRGNTALKRVVSVASVAAMAIAGAVLAAPAASAAAGVADSVRATPAADAAWVDADGNLATTYSAANTFGTPSATGTANLLAPASSYQVGNGVQIALPSGIGSSAWTAGATITLTLTNGTFSTGPTTTLNTTLVDLDTLDTNAGFNLDNNKAHAATAVPSGTKLSSATVTQSLNAAKDALTLTLAAGDPGAGVALSNYGYLLSVANVRVTTPAASDLFTGVVSVAVTSDSNGTTAGGASYTAGSTTLGYVAPATLVTSSGATVKKNTAASQALPPLTLTEGARDTFADTQAYTITAPTAVKFDTSNVAVKGSGSTNIGDTVVNITGGTTNVLTLTIDDTAAGLDNASVERFTVSGLKVTGVSGDSLDLELAGSGFPVTAVNTAAAGFSFAPALASVSLSISTEAPSARTAGDDRYDTAAIIAGEFADAYTGTLDSVVIANGETYKDGVDALAANYLAGQENAPILLTQADTLPKVTKDALTSLFKNSSASITVYVMGKADSVSDDVANEIKAAVEATVLPLPQVEVKRVAGDDRFETSADAASTPNASGIGQFAFKSGDSLQRTAILASGLVNADSLAAGSVSAGAHIPVLLTGNGALPESVSDAIKNLNITQVIVLGSTDRVSKDVVDGLADLGVTNVKRIAGDDRFETAADLYTFAFAANTATDGGLGLTSSDNAYLANGLTGFADALAVGPLAGLADSPILTVPADKLPASASDFLKAHSAKATTNPGNLTQVTALGQSDRISADVLTAAQDALK